MNYSSKSLGLACLALASSSHCLADPSQGFYAGAGISRWNYDQLAPAVEGQLHTLEFNAGYRFNPLLSSDIRLGTSLGDEEWEVGSGMLEVALDSYGSAYWRPEVGNEVAKLYGLFGYTRVEVSADRYVSGSQSSRDFSDSGPSFGAGVGFYYDPNVVLNAEWKQLIDGDGFEIGGFTASFDYRF